MTLNHDAIRWHGQRMGAPTRQGLTVRERRFVKLRAESSATLGVPLSDTACAERAGFADPHAQAAKIAARPRVQRALAELLASPTIKARCKQVLVEGLSLTVPKDPVGAQRERRQTVETIGRFTGELGADVALGVSVTLSADDAQVRQALSALSRFQQAASVDATSAGTAGAASSDVSAGGPGAGGSDRGGAG